MGFKYEEGRVFIVRPRGRGSIYACDDERTIGVELNISDLYRVNCYGGRFHVKNRYVSMSLTEKQMNIFFVKPFVGIAKD